MLPWPLIARTSILAALGVGLGLALNPMRDEPLALGWYEPAATCEVSGAVQPVVAPPTTISQLCSRNDVLIIDTRPSEAFARGHVAGATHLPCSAPLLRAERMLELVGPRRAVVVYGERTADALEVAHSLTSHVPTLETYVIEGGFEAWQSASLACVSGPCDQCTEHSAHAH